MGNTSSAARDRSAGYPDVVNKIVVWGHTRSWLLAIANKGSDYPIQVYDFSSKVENAVVPPGVVTALKKNSGKVAVRVGSTVELKNVSDVKNSKQYQKIGTPVRLVSSSNGDRIEVSYYYKAVSSSSSKPKKSAPKPKKPATNTVVPVPAQDPNEYQWNLPPHKWSMPFRAGYDPKNMPDNSPNTHTIDKYRRGRIWWKATDSSLTITDSNGKTTNVDSSDRKYGFQFLWNPEAFSTQVSVQMDATPQSQDRFLGTVGAFPATETISFTIRIDRTNDFACANANFKRPTNIINDVSNSGMNNFIGVKEVSEFIKYYQHYGSFSSTSLAGGKVATIEKKLVELFQRGTLADIEYLYKAINGPGPGSTASGGDFWKNARGIITADIGFLMPTLLNIDIGPLSYMGYVTSLQVNHLSFTESMIPMRSDVTISLNLLATAGITSGGVV
jgi:hypothetical protein